MSDRNKNKIKHIICIQDISCFGKCSLTIALPILNAAGHHVSPLPTSLLSTHTGGLGKPYIHDLHHDMQQIKNHWQTLQLSVDALYSGYASNQEQIHEIIHTFQQYPHALHLVDPVMGDHGKRYFSLDEPIETAMKALCMEADIITPNMTEAYILLDEPYKSAPYQESELIRITKALQKHYDADIILTGAAISEKQLGCVSLDKTSEPQIMMSEHLPYRYHGSGDLFTSAFLGAYLNNHTLTQACKTAMSYTTMCMKYSYENSQEERYGILFEPLLSEYMKLCQS